MSVDKETEVDSVVVNRKAASANESGPEQKFFIICQSVGTFDFCSFYIAERFSFRKLSVKVERGSF